MQTCRIAVAGAGLIGREHCKLLAGIPSNDGIMFQRARPVTKKIHAL